YLDRLGYEVDWPDHEAATSARESTHESLGRVAEITEWLSGAQACFPPRPFARVRVVVFGGPAGAAMGALADELGAGVTLVDPPPGDAAEALAAGAALADDEVD